MEPRPYLRIVVSGVAVRSTRVDPPPASSAAAATTAVPLQTHPGPPDKTRRPPPRRIAQAPDKTHPQSAENSDNTPAPASAPQLSYHCEIRLKGFPTQSSPVPSLPPDTAVNPPEPDNHVDSASIAASFYLDHPTLKSLLLSSSSPSCYGLSDCPSLDITISSSSPPSPAPPPDRRSFFSALWRPKPTTETLGRLSIPIDMDWARPNLIITNSGWFRLNEPAKTLGGQQGRVTQEVHLKVKVESEPRYVFEFEGQPELNPQVVQIQGSLRQPIFSCTFTRDRVAYRASSFEAALNTAILGGKAAAKGENKEERKGWMVIIHDLSGSKVAVASMVTPFVPTSGSDRVTKSNPGAWLILRPGGGGRGGGGGGDGNSIWMPWGRLEAWREKGDGVAFRLELASASLVIAETVINAHRGGDFTIDTTFLKSTPPPPTGTGSDPRNNCGADLDPHPGFVMSTRVQAQGKPSKPHVLLATRHVTCVEDAAVFIALAAALDLSMDACLPFSRKLGKTFSQNF